MIADLKDIKLELTDQTRSDLWAKIRLNTKGILQEYHRDNLSAEIVRTAEATIQRYSDNQAGELSQLRQDVALISASVSSMDDDYVKTSAIDINGNGLVLSAGTSTRDFAQAVGSVLSINQDAINLFANKIKVRGEMIVDDTVTASKISTGAIKANHIASDAITGDKISVDQAFFNKLTANDAYLSQLFANNAFFTQVQSVTLSANQISGGTIEALNSAMKINLNQSNITFNQNATIDFNSANNALVRRNGTHTAFLHFEDVPPTQDNYVGSIYAGLGVTSSGDGINSKSAGRFAGLRIYRAASGTNHAAILDEVQVYGDQFKIRDDFSINRGFNFHPAGLESGTVYDMNYISKKSLEAINAIRILRRCIKHILDVNALGNQSLYNALNARLNENQLRDF